LRKRTQGGLGKKEAPSNIIHFIKTVMMKALGEPAPTPVPW